MRQLIVARKRQLQRDPKALHHAYQYPIRDIQQSAHLDGHDGNTSDQGTNRQVHHRILRSVFRNDFDDHISRKDGDEGDVEQEC